MGHYKRITLSYLLILEQELLLLLWALLEGLLALLLCFPLLELILQAFFIVEFIPI